MEKSISAKVGQGIFLYLLALGEEGSEHGGARRTKVLATEVSFGHVCLDGHRLAPIIITTDGKCFHRPDGTTNIRGWTGDILVGFTLTCSQELLQREL